MTELTNFSSWWIEAALFVAVAALLPKLLRFNQPRALLWYWQTVALAAVLLGPASIPLQTRQRGNPVRHAQRRYFRRTRHRPRGPAYLGSSR